jgi:hypothetical protein
MEKPSAMPHQEYISLTKFEKIYRNRNLPDHRDGFITVEGHPHFVVRYGQVEFKTPDHGRAHGLMAYRQMKKVDHRKGKKMLLLFETP